MEAIRHLRELIDRHCGNDGKVAALPQVQLLRLEAPVAPVPVLYQPVLCIIAQGSRCLEVAGNRLFYNENCYLVASAEIPVKASTLTATSKTPFLSFGLLLDRTKIASLLADTPQSFEAEIPPVCALATSPISEEMLSAAVRFLGLLDRPHDIPILGPLFERELLYYLLRGPQGQALRQIVRDGTIPKRVHHVMTWLRKNYAKPFQMNTLLEISEMSASSLHTHFKAFTNLTPLQYHKQIRLQEAKRLLIEDASDAAEVSFKVGYGSPTQFSREYRRFFGMAPIQDTARMCVRPQGQKKSGHLTEIR